MPKRRHSLAVDIKSILDELAPQLLARHGVGYETASQLLIAAGDNPHRLAHERSYAALYASRMRGARTKPWPPPLSWSPAPMTPRLGSGTLRPDAELARFEGHTNWVQDVVTRSTTTPTASTSTGTRQAPG